MQKRFFVSSYISFVTNLILILLLYVFFRHTVFLLIFLLLLSFPALSYMYSRSIFNRLTFDISFYPSIAVKQGECELYIKINNPSAFPYPSLMVDFYTESIMYHERVEQTHVIPLKTGENMLKLPFIINKCGLYEAGIISVTGFDLFHLFSFKKDVPGTAEVKVFPERKASGEPHEALYSEGFDEFEETSKTGNVSSNVTDIREYRPGDRLQRIHWKLSQKIDKLMVKENESTSTNEFFVLTELYQPDFKDSKNNREVYYALDEAFENTSAIAEELLAAGLPFVYAVYSVRTDDFITNVIRSREDLEQAFSAAFYEPAYNEENLGKSVFERAGYSKGTLIHVTHRGIEDV